MRNLKIFLFLMLVPASLKKNNYQVGTEAAANQIENGGKYQFVFRKFHVSEWCSQQSASACKLNAHCLDCIFPSYCPAGSTISINCTAPQCEHQQPREEFNRETKCRFCWQLDDSELDCEVFRNCSTNDVALHRTVCHVKPTVLCAGTRTFHKKMRCHWTSGYSWRKALLLSITLGGFGVDRFYLGHWKSAIGKLFSFGGLGVWTLLDIFLIGIGYIQPADESLYI